MPAGIPPLASTPKQFRPSEAAAKSTLQPCRIEPGGARLALAPTADRRDPNDWPAARSLLEWGCAYLREETLPPSPFEREWMRLSVALSEQHLDETYLLDEHLKHAENRFPDDPEFKAARLLARTELNRLTRRPFTSAYALLRQTVSSSPIPGVNTFTRDTASPRVRGTAYMLEELAKDPASRPIALLRLGVLHFELGEIAVSRRHLTAALDASTDPFNRYLAYLVTGLAFDIEKRSVEAAEAFASAVTLDPALTSGAVQLAAHYQLLNRPDDASAVLDTAFRSRRTMDDPWQYPCAHCNGWSRRIADVHAMVRR